MCSLGISIAIRPEKLKVSKTEPKSAKLVKLQGSVRDVAYYGDTSHLVIGGKNDLDLSVTVQNDSRTGEGVLARGEKVWVAFEPEDSIVLTE